MQAEPPNYWREFARSPQHVWLGVLTVGLGFLSAQPLFLLGGVVAYALGWIYMPEAGFFRGWVERRAEAARQAASSAQVAEFIQKREALMAGLSQSRRERYRGLSEVCRGIEIASKETSLTPGDPGADPRLRKLDELMWTFLRLLSIEESLERFLETERREDVPGLLAQGEQEITRLKADVEALKAKGGTALVEPRQRLLSSRLERFEVLQKRLQRIEQARENLALVVSEQDRLEQQIKLIRADSVATKNAEALTARIDATVEHLDQTNKWLAEMDEFKDLVGDLPPAETRIGYETPIPPVIETRPPGSRIGQRTKITYN